MATPHPTHDPMVDPDAQLLPRQPVPPVTRLNKKVVRGVLGGLGLVTLGVLLFSPDLTSWLKKKEAPPEASITQNEAKPGTLNALPDLYAQQAEPPPPKEAPPPAPPPDVPRPRGGRPPKVVKRTSLLPNGAPDVARALPEYLSQALQPEGAEEKAQQATFTNQGKRLDAPGRYAVMQGSVIPAVLHTRLNSDLCGDFTAKVSEAVYDTRTGHHLVIPQGTTIVGVYDCDIEYGDRLIPVLSSRLIFPDTSSMPLDDGFPAMDPRGTPGVPGKVNNHYGRVAIAVLASAVLGTATRFAAGNVSVNRGINPGQDFALNAARETERAGDRILNRELNVPPTITTRPGQRMLIFVQKDLVFPEPYAEK